MKKKNIKMIVYALSFLLILFGLSICVISIGNARVGSSNAAQGGIAISGSIISFSGVYLLSKYLTEQNRQ